MMTGLIRMQFRNGASDNDLCEVIATGFIGEEDVGRVLICLSPKIVVINMIQVHPEYQRQGVATQMLTIVKERFQNSKIDAFVIQPYLVAVFTKLGFVVTDCEHGGHSMTYLPPKTTFALPDHTT